MIEPAPVVSDSVAGKKKAAGKATATVKKTAKKTAGNAPATAATEEWPFEWLPFGMQE